MQRTLEVAIKCVTATAIRRIRAAVAVQSIVSMLEVVPFMFDLLLVIRCRWMYPTAAVAAWASCSRYLHVSSLTWPPPPLCLALSNFPSRKFVQVLERVHAS